MCTSGKILYIRLMRNFTIQNKKLTEGFVYYTAFDFFQIEWQSGFRGFPVMMIFSNFCGEKLDIQTRDA